MAGETQPAPNKTSARAMAVVELLVADYHPRDFAVELWDGLRLDPDPGQFCRFTWHINNANALRALLRSDRQVALGEAYIYGGFDIDGDILAIFPVAEYLDQKHWGAKEKLHLASLLVGFRASNRGSDSRAGVQGKPHSKTRDRQAVTFHYDVSNEFYQLWLDRSMTYSCAYFTSAEDSLDASQEQKLDYLCRKLRLRRGERLLDLGCGWGGLIRHAVKHYGVNAVGITLSEQQLSLAEQRIQESGLAATCAVRLMDYRDAPQLGEFDKIVSVGMVEHVGENKLPEYFRTAFSLLKPGGAFLNHGIGRAGNREKPSEPTFTDIHVFPDGELVPIAAMLRAAEDAGFEVRDVENLREHYFLTLGHWLRRLEAGEQQARQIVGEVKYRIWRLYLAGSAFYFQSGKLDVYQSLLIKTDRGRCPLPLTRADWYGRDRP
jgi:cyclopropane-fatty-acyl-phospholipid synthase